MNCLFTKSARKAYSNLNQLKNSMMGLLFTGIFSYSRGLIRVVPQCNNRYKLSLELKLNKMNK